MADYKELLRRAVEALPENNGAARRAVYEKARAALVGQLRAINPPLPARDITTHRLQLEDCIRQVEQEASEAVIAGIGQEPPTPAPQPTQPASPPPLATVTPQRTAPRPAATVAPRAAAPSQQAAKPAVSPPPKVLAQNAGDKNNSIEDIIAAAERDTSPAAQKPAAESKPRPPKSQPVLVAKNNNPPPAQAEERPAPPKPGSPPARPLPSIVARAEAAKGRSAGAVVTPIDARGRSMVDPRRDGRSGLAAMRNVEPEPFELPEEMEAMSAVREVEVEPQPVTDPQGAIDRAIATLDREARGEAVTPGFEDLDDEPMQAPRRNGSASGFASLTVDDGPIGRNGRGNKPPKPAREFANPRRTGRDASIPRAMREGERGGMGAVSIFLIVFAVLLLGAGGAGFWAWQEGYINLDAMFGKGEVATQQVAQTAAPAAEVSGPGNTETPSATAQPSTELKANERLPAATDTAAATQVSVQPLALQSPSKVEERLGASSPDSAATAEQAVAAIAPGAGSQSLLLEASDDGKTGAVPFSGSVSWSKGVDETGAPTLIGKASIPARNLSVDVLIRKNSDPGLPASHLMEVNFSVSDTFIGGSIAGLPGVLLKNEELVQGSPLVGASARVVGNSFLFALSAAPEDNAANIKLLTSRKWIDLALIYATGKRAIITLEKDANAQKMFDEVFAAWGQAPAPKAQG
jgi:hypothetical protein